MRKLVALLVVVFVLAVPAFGQALGQVHQFSEFGTPITDDRPITPLAERRDRQIRPMATGRNDAAAASPSKPVIPGGLIPLRGQFDGRWTAFFVGSIPAQSAVYSRVYYPDGQTLNLRAYWFGQGAPNLAYLAWDENLGTASYNGGCCAMILEVAVASPAGYSVVWTDIPVVDSNLPWPIVDAAAEFPSGLQSPPSLLQIFGEFPGDLIPRVFVGFTDVSDSLDSFGTTGIVLRLGSGKISQVPPGVYPLTVCYYTCDSTVLKHRRPVVSGGKG